MRFLPAVAIAILDRRLRQLADHNIETAPILALLVDAYTVHNDATPPPKRRPVSTQWPRPTDARMPSPLRCYHGPTSRPPRARPTTRSVCWRTHWKSSRRSICRSKRRAFGSSSPVHWQRGALSSRRPRPRPLSPRSSSLEQCPLLTGLLHCSALSERRRGRDPSMWEASQSASRRYFDSCQSQIAGPPFRPQLGGRSFATNRGGSGSLAGLEDEIGAWDHDRNVRRQR